MSTTSDGLLVGSAPVGGGASVVPLASAEAQWSGTAGVKAATLARLLAAGFAVPDGCVVTVDACARIEHDISEDVRARIAAELDRLGGGRVAVRSSAEAEDLDDASFAGQYETVLGVEGVDAVCEAVRRCIHSASSERVRAYAGTAGGGIAVLVQRLVEADAAGVAFSANPVTGDRDEVLVSAVRGLGDRLVGGEATPDEWVVRDGDARCLAAPEQAIDAQQALAVADLARRLEAQIDAPQDVEWAVAAGQLYLLQSRPITALPRPPEFVVPKGQTWLKDTGHYPEPVTPLGFSLYSPALEAGTAEMCREFGLMMDGLEQRCIGGEVYGHPVPAGGKEGMAPPPWWVLGILARLVPPMRRKLRAAREALRSGALEGLPEQWEREWREQFREAARRLRSVELAALSDAELEAQLDDATALLTRGQEIHFRLFIPYVVRLHELVVACEELLGWSEIEALELVAGLSEASSEPARALRSLADEARGRPRGREALAGPTGEIAARLGEADPEFVARFAAYLESYGTRAVSYDPGAPTLAERPQLLASLLRDAVEAGASVELQQRLREQRERSAARAQEQLAGRPAAERERFAAALAAAQRTYPLREDNIFWTDNVPCGLLRRIALELGRRLAERGLLRRAEDVVFLKVDEARAALRGEAGLDLPALVRARRAEQAWVLAHPGPAYLGLEPTVFPDLRGFPEEARRVNGALMWMMGHEFAPPAAPEAGELRGAPGSPGRYTGPARVIRSEEEFGRLRPGEVLVCPVTTPVWSVLFANAGALVTDGGGALSHAAIIAREHGIPAVVGTGTATGTLRDGQIVTVDGTRGSVRVEE